MKKIIVPSFLAVIALLLLTACGCKHENQMLLNEKPATCTENGYSGDRICMDCKETLEEGKEIEATGHSFELKGNMEESCTQIGYTGDLTCNICGYVETEGTKIEALGHVRGESDNAKEATCTNEGFTGDTTCTRCGTFLPGEVVERLPHAFGTDHVCADCGYMEGGLYVDGELVKTWISLIDEGIVEISEDSTGAYPGMIAYINTQLTGKLVVEDGVNTTRFYNTGLEEIWLPVSVMKTSGFKEESLQKVRFFSNGETIVNVGSFEGCSSLKEVILPQLMSPDSTYQGMFRLCKSLEEIELPDAVDQMGAYMFELCSSLKKVVLSKSIPIVFNAFNGCTSLETVICKEGPSLFGPEFSDCSALKEVIIPKSLTEFDFPAFNRLPEEARKNLTIKYRGDEESWKQIKNADMLSDIKTEFNYSDEYTD